MKTRVKKLINADLEKKIIYLMFFALAFLGLMYGYWVNQAILNVVEREKLETNLTELGSKVGELEVEYMSLKESVTLELAYEMGFRNAKDTKFVSRKSLGQGLTLNSR